MYVLRAASALASAAAASAASAAGPAHQPVPVPSLTEVSVCARPTATDFLTSQRRTRARPSSTYPSVFWGNLRPTFPNPFQPFPPHDTLESLLTTFGALSGSHFRGELKLKSAAQGPGVFALCRERYTSDLSPTVSLRPSTLCPLPPESIHPSSSSSQPSRHALCPP